ncbi:DUF3160 domain-containing protein [Candidatus Falkowbacteria bacterium]|nr:DUF3160 domain-containing protein [Candidatus Falkowbacteria bacterium]
MFENLGQNGGISQPSSTSTPDGKMQVFLVGGLVGLILIGMIVAGAKTFLFKPKPAPLSVATSTPKQNTPATTTGAGLPDNTDATTTDPYGWNASTSNIKAEALRFSDFYDQPSTAAEPKVEKMVLPVSVKTDTVNYYEFSRKLALDEAQLQTLGNNGFVIIDNPFKNQGNDFYGVMNALSKKDLPVFISSDFVWYYYQNQMKGIFSDIKTGIFYQDLWQLDKDFYQVASARYKAKREKPVEYNDPVGEAERLETAFFAVGLELMRPKDNQVAAPGLSTNGKFSAMERDGFVFELPNYLSDDVAKELKLIYAAKGKAKSPVLLYERDYSEFTVPKEYQGNAKLTNFYLAHRWFNSVFPLYFKDKTCETCLLDRNDWLVNFIANSFITKDFSNNQDLKNRWARIYKVVAYFSGLRSDLTYLQYDQVMANIFGADYNPEIIFAVDKDRGQAEQAALKIQAETAKIDSFSPLEGGYDRGRADLKPLLGMRLLQTDYWPDNYIFDQLTFPNIGNYVQPKYAAGEKAQPNVTSCQDRKKGTTRCYGLGLDVMNILKPLSGNSFFNENTAYENYTKQSTQVKEQMSYFNVSSWHSSQYWSTLDILRKTMLDSYRITGPIYTDNQQWQNRQASAALATWLNLRLPDDQWKLNLENLGVGELSQNSYFIEPNLALFDEYLANTKMLGRMLTALRIVKDVDLTGKKLAEVQDDTVHLRAIVIKELNGEALDSNDLAQLANFSRRNLLTSAGNKKGVFTFSKGDSSKSIEGVNLMVVIEELKGRKYLSVGPVFNFTENKSKK